MKKTRSREAGGEGGIHLREERGSSVRVWRGVGWMLKLFWLGYNIYLNGGG